MPLQGSLRSRFRVKTFSLAIFIDTRVTKDHMARNKHSLACLEAFMRIVSPTTTIIAIEFVYYGRCEDLLPFLEVQDWSGVRDALIWRAKTEGLQRVNFSGTRDFAQSPCQYALCDSVQKYIREQLPLGVASSTVTFEALA